MTTFSGKICTEYEDLPNTCPDFVFIDGPSQHSVTGTINRISTVHCDRLPMACDILNIEHFPRPGTLIMADGKTTSARFMGLNLQRNWIYAQNTVGHIHTPEMCEPAHDLYNQRQINFCLDGVWSKQFG